MLIEICSKCGGLISLDASSNIHQCEEKASVIHGSTLDATQEPNYEGSPKARNIEDKSGTAG